MQCLEGFDTAPNLHSITAPVLVMTGAHDYITPPIQGRRIVAAVPNGQYIELAASGHFPFVEEPDVYLDGISTWLAKHVPSAGGRNS